MHYCHHYHYHSNARVMPHTIKPTNQFKSLSEQFEALTFPAQVPTIPFKTLGKMGLKGTPGIRGCM
jgi:hypothetical protein